jgi:hypothetical protein
LGRRPPVGARSPQASDASDAKQHHEAVLDRVAIHEVEEEQLKEGQSLQDPDANEDQNPQFAHLLIMTAGASGRHQDRAYRLARNARTRSTIAYARAIASAADAIRNDA